MFPWSTSKKNKEILWKEPLAEQGTTEAFSGKYIKEGNAMRNFRLVNDPLFESQKGKYYFKNSLRLLDLPINKKTIKNYKARLRGLNRSRKNKPIYLSTRLEKAANIQTLKEQKFKFDLTTYQNLLASEDSATKEKAVEDLVFLKSLLLDARKMRQIELIQKYKNLKRVGRVAALLGLATSVAGVAGVGSQIAEEAIERSPSAAFSVTSEVGEKISQTNKLKLGVETLGASKEIILEVVSLSLLLAASNLAAPGFALGVVAVVTTLFSLGISVEKFRVKRERKNIEVNGDQLLQDIDTMIHKNGQIFRREQNPMFAKDFEIQEKLHTILNTQENDQVIASIETSLGENTNRALTLLDTMIENAENPKRNMEFERNLYITQKMEAFSNINAQRLRNRRNKLKRLRKTKKNRS